MKTNSVRDWPEADQFVAHGRVWAVVDSDIGLLSRPLWCRLRAKYGRAPRMAGWVEVVCPDCDDCWYFLVYLFEDAFERGFLKLHNAMALENFCCHRVKQWIVKNPHRVPAKRGLTCNLYHEPIEIAVRASRSEPLIRLSREYDE